VRVTFLGTGTSQGIPVIGSDHPVCLSKDPRDQRLRSSVLVQTDTLNLVIDTGPDFRQQMLRTDIKKIDAILFTHEHRDHTAGFDDVRPFNFMQSSPMQVFATKRVCDALHRDYSYIFEDNPYPGAPSADLHIIENNPFDVFGQKIIPIEVMHLQLPVLGFRIGDFTYITDAKTIAPDELDKARGSKVLVLNALRIQEHYSHFNLKEALDIVRQIAPERAYFTHISHLLGFHAKVEATLPKNVFLAYDTLQIKI
jgi:phosphoribosyl 1,2-cyclic phosphate phosphodiesterase